MDVNYNLKKSPSYHFNQRQCCTQPIPMASQSKACVCGRSLSGTVGYPQGDIVP